MNGKIIGGLLMAIAVAGCATTAPLKGHADLLDFLADGRTAREEVVLKLGQPSGKFERENIVTYRLGFEPKNKGYYVVEREAQSDGWSTWLRAKYSLVLVFDDGGVLRKHSLVEVN
ncbi:MAG: hypothetical protein MUF81_00945 [Verrucomicrobia bacterium]|jgi:hypothetical protein|nr:hypothetical protein [Verrucomicrobiota bacterium]